MGGPGSGRKKGSGGKKKVMTTAERFRALKPASELRKMVGSGKGTAKNREKLRKIASK